LPTQELRPLIRRTLTGDGSRHEMVLPAVNRRGRPILVRVVGSVLNGTDGSASGAILLMEQDGQGIPHADDVSPELMNSKTAKPMRVLPIAVDRRLRQARLTRGGVALRRAGAWKEGAYGR